MSRSNLLENERTSVQWQYIAFIMNFSSVMTVSIIWWYNQEFVLTSSLEFAFYVNKNGRRSRREFMVHWEGLPTGFGRCANILYGREAFSFTGDSAS